MLEMVVGAFLAVIFLGLPLAIIGLFVASTLDRRKARPSERFRASGEPAALASATNHGDDRRRVIVYGLYPVVTTAPAKRKGPTRALGRKA